MLTLIRQDAEQSLLDFLTLLDLDAQTADEDVPAVWACRWGLFAALTRQRLGSRRSRLRSAACAVPW